MSQDFECRSLLCTMHVASRHDEIVILIMMMMMMMMRLMIMMTMMMMTYMGAISSGWSK